MTDYNPPPNAPDTQETLRLSNNQVKANNKQNKKMRKYFLKYKESMLRDKQKLERKIEILKSVLGKQDFNALKEICTVKVPERLSDKGEVISKASSKVNYSALLVEGRLAIALNREARIKAGKRKRATGRSSRRATHNDTVRFINQRNLEITKNGD